MSRVSVSELRTSTRALLERAKSGEEITITVHGRPVAVLGPVRERTRWTSKTAFLEALRPARSST